MRLRRSLGAVLPALLIAVTAACSIPVVEREGEPIVERVERPTVPPAPEPVLQPLGDFSFAGEQTQGGWIRGILPPGTVEARIDGQAFPFAPDGSFFTAFDRDAGGTARLLAKVADGRTVERTLTISPRAWNIEHVNVARTGSTPTQAFMRVREPELAQIAAAREVRSDSEGWKQSFIWPATGRISGRFGSQRIYRGEPASYHSGLDIAAKTGTPFVAPADGVVVLAAQTPFSLEGKLLIIDHGMGLNSAFLHCSEIMVREGDRVSQGQTIGRIGATGRATGPHLHWGMKWLDARIDPLLFTGLMP